MTPVQPIQQPPIADLRNVLQMLQLDNAIWPVNDRLVCDLVGRIARLIHHAIEGLSEPNLASIQAAATMLREADGSYANASDQNRYARDAAAVILRAAVTGELPKTWEES